MFPRLKKPRDPLWENGIRNCSRHPFWRYTAMSSILGLDLGKYRSVACLFHTNTGGIRITTVSTSPDELRMVFEQLGADQVVFETSTVARWVADLCAKMSIPSAIANTMDEAWSCAQGKTKNRPGRCAMKLALLIDDNYISPPSPCRRARHVSIAD